MSSASLSSMPKVLRLWGKTGPDGAFHPALCHMLDVGNIAQALLGIDASPRIRSLLAHAFRSDPDRLALWLPLFVALHDIGKVSAPFQGQSSQPATQAQRDRLLSEGFDFGRLPTEPHPHNTIGAVYVKHRLSSVVPPLPERLINVLRDAISGHHGKFVSNHTMNSTRKYIHYYEPEHWTLFRDDAVRALVASLAPEWPEWNEPLLPHEPDCRAATLMLAGFIILCDWLGSDSDRFPIASAVSLEEYVPVSRERARGAVADLGFLTPHKPSAYVDFPTLFPDKAPGRPLQLAVDELPLDRFSTPALFIVEGPTGEGKTELALALARRLASLDGASDELYFGLPTMSTSNQMFGRLDHFVKAVYGTGHTMKLIHSQAFLVEDDLRLSLYADFDAADRQGVSAPTAHQWFAPKKRALLWPFGVGTVDQIELTVLNARHYMLRLFGLAGKVVIIDEVHAYDVYMSTIIQHALRWLANLGTSVILLSATLPSARHAELARSFREGLSTSDVQVPADPPHPLPYPALAAYTARSTLVLNPPADQPDRHLDLKFVHESSVAERARDLLSLVEHGGAACYVCNTVQDAQDVYRELLPLCPEGVRPILLHSRFPLEDRQAIEGKLRTLFGPDSERTPAERFVVVGTQVLEQSLDVDFDVMLSDMAPIDLLLQRAGRMHRHSRRARPSAYRSPVLLVRLPLSKEDHRPLFFAWSTIYDEYVLWRTWLTLLDEGVGPERPTAITLPVGYRSLIEATYAENPTAHLPPTPFADIISAAYNAYCKQLTNQQGEAHTRHIPDPDAISAIIEGINITFEEDEDGGKTGWGIARTRLGEERITIIPLHKVGDNLSVDAGGKEIVGPDVERGGDLSRGLQLRLLRRSIPVSHKRLVPALREAAGAAPGWFRNAPLLKDAALLVLQNGSAPLDGTRVSLDPQLGLVIA